MGIVYNNQRAIKTYRASKNDKTDKTEAHLDNLEGRAACSGIESDHFVETY